MSAAISDSEAIDVPGGAIRYDMAVVRGFALSSLLWGLVGMLVGLLAALQLAWPELNWGPYLHFGRIRPVHTNAVIFGFTLGVVFTGSYYGIQRLCRVRMFSDTLSRINLWGWNAIIVAAAISLLLGKTTSKEYAELEWPIDIAHRGGLGGLRGQRLRHPGPPSGEVAVRGDLVLDRDGRDDRHAAHREQHGAARLVDGSRTRPTPVSSTPTSSGGTGTTRSASCSPRRSSASCTTSCRSRSEGRSTPTGSRSCTSGR